MNYETVTAMIISREKVDYQHTCRWLAIANYIAVIIATLKLTAGPRKPIIHSDPCNATQTKHAGKVECKFCS